MTQIALGVGLFPTEPPRRMVDLVRLSEQLGYRTAYIGDSQMIWREAYLILGAAAQATSSIRLAAGVTNPVTRDPSVVAAGLVTLWELSEGRTLLGIGIGDSSVETLGRKPSTLADLETAISFIRALVAGETVPHPISGSDVRLAYATRGTRIGVYPAVSSPRIHRLAGRVGDGAIVLVGTDPEYLRRSREALAEGAHEAGRDLPADFRVVCWAPCSIQADGHAAREAVKSHVARILKRRLPFDIGPRATAVATGIRETYEYYDHMVPGAAHSELVPDDLVESFAIAGTPDEVRDQVRRLADCGLVDEIAIIPHTQDPGDREHVIRTMARIVADS